MKVGVIITLLNDHRVLRAMESLLSQTLPPVEILVADGGSRPATVALVRSFASRDTRIHLEILPGSVAQTRAAAIRLRSTDVATFLDADEVAPPAWLASLTKPIVAGGFDFAGGPTRPFAPGKSDVETYLNRHDDWFYSEVVARDISALPMGNSAWRRSVFERIGSFDPAFRWGGEDYDVNLRALAAGFRGTFVPEAWVYHDQSHIDTVRKLMRRKYRYMVGATMAFRKNGSLARAAARSAATPVRFRHRYELLAWFLKPAAFLKGVRAQRRVQQVRSPED